MIWLLKYWKPVAGVLLAVAVLTASYAKGYSDADSKWELKRLQEQVAQGKRGREATKEALKGIQDDIEAIRNRPPAPRVLCNVSSVPRPSGGTDDPRTAGQPGEVGRTVETVRDIGSVTTDILDRADIEAARANRLREWINAIQAGKEKPR